MYANGVMSDANVAKTKDLILLGYTKLLSSDNKMHPGEMKRINEQVLPNRTDIDE